MVRTAQTESPHPSSSTAPKRKRDAEEESEASKRARSRVSFSCGECHRRKQKCDRQVPCSQCVARRVPELCKAYTPGKTDQDISARLARLENIIEMALPHFCSPGTPGYAEQNRLSGSDGLDDDAQSQNGDDPGGGTFRHGKWYGNSASGSLATASVLEQWILICQIQLAQVESRGHRRVNSGDSHAPGSHATETLHIINAVSQDLEPSATDKLKSLVQDCGVSPHKLAELLQELPPTRLSDVLLDYYFTVLNWTRYALSERDFRASYASITENGVTAHPNDVRFLPLLFVVLAISVRQAPEHVAGDARTRRMTSLRYYWSSRRAMLVAAAIQSDSLEMVLTRLLSSRYLASERRVTEVLPRSQLGAAVRTAQAIGLHRDAATMGMDATQVEYRRRIWSYLYHCDRSFALILGRPIAIQDDYTSTLPPSNIDDELGSSQLLNPPPLSSPTPTTLAVLRHSLAAIMGRIVHHFQQVRKPSHYADVLILDDELGRYIDRLPSHYCFEPDTSLDATKKYIPVHRFLLITEILFVRISLHRPYLLRRLGSDRYARSRTACFESALKDFRVRRTFRSSMPTELRDSLVNAYREFQTALMSGIYLVLEPRGEHATGMHEILDGFIDDHEGVRDMDETTRRELKTIEFLKKKVSSAERAESHGMETEDTEHPADAQLLLGLQQSNARASAPKYPSINSGHSSASRGGRSMPYPDPSAVATSPTVQMLQHSTQNEYVLSPNGSGSPHPDDESAAQSLLDYWCNTVGSTDAVGGSAAMQWGPSGDPATLNSGTLPSLGDPSVAGGVGGVDGSDWTYWETLVNEIRAGPSV
ncbi:hypothetical protein FIBSPDRAFT_811926 [Athelia psychrophila]|uniref:Zn(2)-C6 fungal-type domain-containing protein n=1 Tax=Athelia psychrophila TaxID=1759441 RepID=A0A166VRV7_9AGAM|nr:hypothetical protein FIBSPDRAFT_811926 [Fibularhizoctonia sp. CBS 109695]